MKADIFSLLDIIIGLSWAMIILIIGFIIASINKEKKFYKYFLPGLLFKMLFAFIFALTYVFVLEGGDTIAYWEGAVKLNHLFWENPAGFFSEIGSTPSAATITRNFNLNTGYPPGWIYSEPKSFIVSKLLSPLAFVTANSFLGMTFICSAFAFFSSWKLFLFLKDVLPTQHWIIVFATLFVPTVAFWCSGIAKDTIILISLQYAIVTLFSFLLVKGSFTAKNIIIFLFYALLLYKIRSFMLVALLIPFFIVLGLRIIKNITSNKFLRFSLKSIAAVFALIILVAYLSINNEMVTENPYLMEAAIKQEDFAKNKTYTGPKYDLGITDYSPSGMIKAAPISIFTAFYRPFLWEASSLFLLLSGIEGLLLLGLTYSFFFRSGNIFSHLSFVSNQEILVFSLLFLMLLGFFVGFTAGLFNVLVRFKAPLMTLLIIFLASKEKYTAKIA